MTTRRAHDLTAETLDALPAACRSCAFWEAGRPPAKRGDAATQARKKAWWHAIEVDWGVPGKAIYDDGRLVGYAGFGPPDRLLGAARIGGDVSDDAVLLTTIWVAPDYRRCGLAKVLLQSVLRETYRHGGRALEAYGARGGSSPSCVVSEAFLVANGFSVVRDDYPYPRLRLDLRQTVRWQESVSSALESVVAVLARRERRPVPAGTAATVRTGRR